MWIRASAPGFGLPIETTPITEVWNDTGILPTTGPLLSEDVLSVRQGKISPLKIKRPAPILGEKKHLIQSYKTF